MMSWLLALQFGLLVLPLLMIGLVIYGSDFDTATGWLSLLPLLGLPVLHFLPKPDWCRLDGIGAMLASVLGAVVALVLCRLLYFHVWDEHSLLQAGLLALLTLTSYVSSLRGMSALRSQTTNRAPVIGALLIFSVVWGLSYYFAFLGFLAVALILALSAVWRVAVTTTSTSISTSSVNSVQLSFMPPLAAYICIVSGLDVFPVVWDWQVDSQWAIALGISFFGVTVAMAINPSSRPGVLLGYLLLLLLSVTATSVWPQLVLSHAHAFVAGVLWGVALGWFLPVFGRPYVGRVWLSVLLALLISYTLYANLAFAWARLLLLLPLIYPLIRSIRAIAVPYSPSAADTPATPK